MNPRLGDGSAKTEPGVAPMTQREMVFDPPARMSVMEERFRKFHADNPRVYELFCQFAAQIIAAGKQRYSADAVIHRIRWHTSIETRSDDGLKINDHFSAAYARLYVRDYPQHSDLFRLRRSVFDSKIEVQAQGHDHDQD